MSNLDGINSMNNFNRREADPKIESIVAISDAMFGGVKVVHPTLSEKLKEALIHAAKLKAALAYLSIRCEDLNGNIEESVRNAEEIILNLNGIKRE